MAAKKDKTGIEALRSDVQTLSEAFWSFRDAMITNAAVQEAEQQSTPEAAPKGTISAASEQDVDATAAILAALGHPVRLRIALALANDAVSVNAIVEHLKLKTTGAAYHHLNVMINHGVVVQPQRGTFTLAPDSAPQVHRLLGAVFGIEPETEEQSAATSKKKKD